MSIAAVLAAVATPIAPHTTSIAWMPSDMFGVAGLNLTGVGVWSGVLLLVGRWVQQWLKDRPAMKAIEVDAEVRLRADLMEMIANLREALATQAEACAEDSRTLRAEITVLRERMVQYLIDQAREHPRPVLVGMT